ncbi:hypothetical protein [Marinobacterium rhizophilum]|uniref:hypothetical protein n=1 Tax=Marinobacterium rhizophilum TaxID=420402 RepID=UPI00036D0632|nr:hypothetical protein [Marinobacterium rhizophilum]
MNCGDDVTAAVQGYWARSNRLADKFPYYPKHKYTPSDAPKDKLFELRDYLVFERNLIVRLLLILFPVLAQGLA